MCQYSMCTAGPMLYTRKRTTVKQACPSYASTRPAKLSASGDVVVNTFVDTFVAMIISILAYRMNAVY